MNILKQEFSKNDIDYTILERTNTRYFAELKSMESGIIIGFETGRIVQSKEGTKSIKGITVNFQASESIVGNEKFGFDKFECFYPS